MESKSEFGITLIELIVTIAIISILASVAFPFSHSLFARFEAKKTISTLETVLIHTKHQAYLYHYRAAICGSNDAVYCSSGNWNKYILVFKDTTLNRIRDNNESILQIIPLSLKYGNLNWSGASARNVVFHADSGLPRGSNGSFTYCSHQYSNLNIRLFLSDMGHYRTEKINTC